MGGFINAITGGNDNFQAQNTPGFAQAVSQTNNNYNQTYGQQQGLDTQLQGIATNGSSLAQNQLTAATGQNIAEGAGMVESQKGLNPALAARLAGQQTSQANQQAANQSAQLQAQTQMGAMGQLAGNLSNQGSQAVSYNSALQQQQSANNVTNAGVAATNATNAQKTTGGLLGGGAAGIAKLAGSQGGKIPGAATVPGDSLKNDTVSAMLSPGEIVVPRTQAADPEKAKAFIDALMKDKKAKGEGDKSYGDVLAAHRNLHARISQLEQRLGGGNNGR
jgi:hypothetical protein